jgi:hypothetical protein
MFGSLAAYAEWIELETFFSGFTFIYVLYWLYFQKGNLLGISYALIATLYWGLQLKNNLPDYHYPLLKIWALIALLFWLPALRKHSLLPFLHSLIFFALIVIAIFRKQDNSHKIFAASLLINSCSLILILLVSYLQKQISSRKKLS